MASKSGFFHHVFFWLSNAGNDNDRRELVSGLRSLTGIAEIKEYHIGVPANTNRSVVNNSYSVSWLVRFENAADQDAYQVHPTHLEFVEKYSRLWEKVVVYDAVDAA